MNHKKKDGTVISEEWMDAVAKAAEVDNLLGTAEKKFAAEGNVEVADELLDEWAKPWEEGEIPGAAAGFVAAPGRLRIYDESTR